MQSNILNSQFSILNYIIISTLILNATLSAKSYYELDVHYGFGASDLSFNSVPGFAISVYPAKNFGFSAGMEYSWRWTTKTYELNETNPGVIDSDGDSLIFKYTIDEYKEKLVGKIMQFPIMLKYSNDSYYIAAGAKIGLVQSASASVSYEGLETKGYYPKYEVTFDAPYYQGFGEQKDSSFKTNISSSTLIMLALEGGLRFKLGNSFALIAGVFADYSFNEGFNRTLPPVIERVENKRTGEASIGANDKWKSWQPWSVGLVAKISFSNKKTEEIPQEVEMPAKVVSVPPNHDITVMPVIPQPPTSVPQAKTTPPPPAPQKDEFQASPLPSFLNRKADFVFYYPETRTSPSDLLHMSLISQIADTLKAQPSSQLHCIGYSEKLLSESVAFETALQRSIRIQYTLTRFYGIEEKRIFVYSQGSKDAGYRRAECFLHFIY
jgi:hypothetical protein